MQKLVFFSLIFLLAQPLSAEEKNDDNNSLLWWGTLGTGVFLNEETDGMGQGSLVSITLQKDQHVLIIRQNNFTNENVLDVIFGGEDCSEPNLSATLVCENETMEFKNIGMLYGIRKKNTIYAIGLENSSADSLLEFQDTESLGSVTENRDIYSNVGLVVEAHYHIYVQKNFGISFQAIGSINKDVPYVGATVNVNFGRMM